MRSRNPHCWPENYPGPGPVGKIHWGTSYWNPGPSSRSGGTGILIVNKSIRVKAIQKDSTGRILCLDLNHEGGNFQIMTIYGPNSPGDREFFFDTLQDHAFTTKTMILCGDFNMVENPKLDRQPPVDGSNYTEGNVNLQSFLNSHDLSDQWRMENPSKKCTLGPILRRASP